MTALLFIIAGLATYRVTRLITADKITEALRQRVTSKWLGYLVQCDWCLSIWLAPAPALAVVLWPDNRAVLVVLVALALSAVTGLLAMVEQRLDI
jgi:hypothetical protein